MTAPDPGKPSNDAPAAGKLETGHRSGKRGPVFVVHLEAEPGRGIHELRALLKVLLRRYGLQCVEAREE
jgi:hypothetical protein